MNNRISFLSNPPLDRHAGPHTHTAYMALESWSVQNPSGVGRGKGKRGSPLHLYQSSPVFNLLFTPSLLARIPLTKAFVRGSIWKKKEKEKTSKNYENSVPPDQLCNKC